ncbi:MAG: transposase family protein [Deltaproteobacteria bacterium]|nr:transposase family protein [Deltaproteobacteria bacterium]
MGPVEVITSVERRRHWSAAQKQAMVEEAEEPGNSISSVARKYGIHPNQLFKWRRLANQGALVAVGREEPVVPASEVKHLKAQIRELQRLLGKKTMEVEILKDAIEIAREKKLISHGPLLKKDDTP